MREAILPVRNRKDVEEITEPEIHQLIFHYVTWMDEIPPLALLPAAANQAGAAAVAPPAAEVPPAFVPINPG